MMRPFKFFFAISLGMIVFFFLAKVVFTAVLIAAFMSVIFFLVRKIKYFFQHLAWREYDDQGQYSQRYSDYFQNRNSRVEPLFDEATAFPNYRMNWNRVIEIR